MLLLALSTDGMSIPPGWWCGNKPCPLRMNEIRDSHRDHTTAANGTTHTTTTDTTVPHNGPHAKAGWLWWCLTHPCPPIFQTSNTTVDVAFKNTTTHTTVASNGRQYGPTKWWCGTHTCSATSKEKRDNDIHDDVTNNNTITNTTVPDNDPQRGWVCHGRICPPKLRKIKNRQINDTAVNRTSTNVTASNEAGHRRITPAIVWWCNTHVCPSSMKTVGKRETDSLAFEPSKSP